MDNNAQTQQVQRPLSYTERFAQMEAQMGILLQQYTEANQAFGVAASIVEDLSKQTRMLNDQLQAVYDLAEEGKALSREAVQTKINDKRVKRVKDLLDRDVKAGVLKEIESATSDDNIIVYSSDEISYAFKAVAAFEQDGIKNELLGKKVGETVGKIKIEQVYEIVNIEPTEGTPNEQENQ